MNFVSSPLFLETLFAMLTLYIVAISTTKSTSAKCSISRLDIGKENEYNRPVLPNWVAGILKVLVLTLVFKLIIGKVFTLTIASLIIGTCYSLRFIVPFVGGHIINFFDQRRIRKAQIQSIPEQAYSTLN